MNTGRYALLLGAWLAAMPVAAPQAQDEADEFAALLEVLSEETDVATRTRMNSDFVPGIVTVMDGEKLAALGALTVWDAMPFVPGVEAWLDPTGTPSITVRGLPFPFNTGSVQVLIDSVPIAAEAAGLNGSALLMPIEMVERIEFVRGPGSVIYGDYAFQGLLNIVTRKTGSRAVAGAGSGGAASASVRLSGGGDDWRLTAQVSGLSDDDARIRIGRAAEEERRHATLRLQAGGFMLLANAIGRDLDGRDALQPPAMFDERSHSLEARYERPLREDLVARMRLQSLSNDIDTPGIAFDGGHREAAVELLWTRADGGSWLAGIDYREAEIDSARQQLRGPPNQPPPPPLLFEPRERSAYSAWVQGQLPLTRRLQATVGARYDHTDDVGERITPRASLVWRLGEAHILKAQYAEGFRSPTFFELYSPAQGELDFEVNRTSELSYVFQRPLTTFRATVFDARIDEMVFLVPGTRSFDNVAEARSRGLELEWNRQLGAHWRLDAAAARVDGRDNRNPTLTERDSGAAARSFGNLGLLWTPGRDNALALRWTRAADRPAASGEDDSYDRIDLTWTHRNLFVPGLELRMVAQNLLDGETVYYLPTPNGDLPVRYQDRRLWLRLGLEW